MRHLRSTVLAALAVALCAAPVASAQGPPADGRGVVVVPAQARWWGEFWAQIYSLPVSENPFAGNGNPCLTVGHNVIQEVGRPCTIEQGTAFTLGFGTAWSNVEDPFPQTEAEQRAAALAFDQANVAEVHVTVDGGTPVDIRRPPFEHFSPQRTVQLPADNFLGVAAQTVTLTAHGWTAVVRNLPPGQHTIVQNVVFADGERVSAPHIVTVLPRHADDSDPRHQTGWYAPSGQLFAEGPPGGGPSVTERDAIGGGPPVGRLAVARPGTTSGGTRPGHL